MLIFRDKLSLTSNLKMLSNVPKWWLYRCALKRRLWSARPFACLVRVVVTVSGANSFL